MRRLELALHSNINLHRTAMLFVEGHKPFYILSSALKNERREKNQSKFLCFRSLPDSCLTRWKRNGFE